MRGAPSVPVPPYSGGTFTSHDEDGIHAKRTFFATSAPPRRSHPRAQRTLSEGRTSRKGEPHGGRLPHRRGRDAAPSDRGGSRPTRSRAPRTPRLHPDVGPSRLQRERASSSLRRRARPGALRAHGHRADDRRYGSALPRGALCEKRSRRKTRRRVGPDLGQPHRDLQARRTRSRHLPLLQPHPRWTSL